MSGPDPSEGTTEVKLSSGQIFDITIQLVVGAVFAIASYRILSPFINLMVWGGVIAIAVHPLFTKATDMLGGRRKLAVTLFVLIGLAIIVVPVVIMSTSLFESAESLSESVEEGNFEIPPPPPKVADWPVIGTEVHDFWLQASSNLEAFADQHAKQLKGVVGVLVNAVAGAGVDVLQFILSVLIAGMFLGSAESSEKGLKAIAARIFGEERGGEFIDLSALTVRSVATGVLGVAFIQSVMAGIGMVIAGVPFAGVWAVVVLLFAIMQLPPLIILLPIAIWVLGSADSQAIAWGFFVWAVIVSFSDTFLKPLLLGRGVDVPMIIILLGAIGGMILSGIIGLFIGAVVLALAYRLLVEWLATRDAAGATQNASQSSEA